ncbi:MAG: asparagine synthase (glutamine-hydrolyzing) [Alphaproteobacteria bacterium]
MCGIAGFLASSGGSTQQLTDQIKAMTDTIAYRGPDGEGAWVDADVGVALGHRRLSIQDLTPLGQQPMVSADGQWVMVYNGETYSHKELVPALLEKGVHMRGHSDTEVMLEACAAFGVEAATQSFIGMFAFALWHRPSQTLYLVRDRVGIKPLYWTKTDNGIAFASELKALRALPALQHTIDQSALAAYVRYGYVPATQSIYQGIHKLEPGTILTFRASDSSISQKAYWSLPNVASQRIRTFASDSEAIYELDTLLTDAVGRRLLADVPLGAFLSGGVDSSLVVALMQKQCAAPVKTFTIGFDDNNYNEAHHAKAVAQHLKTDHTELYLTSQEARDVIPRIADMYDEPFADLSQIPTYLVSALARQQVTVSLSGDGGDELFAGYNRYHWTHKIWHLSRYLPLKPWLSQKILGVPVESWQRLQRALPFLPARFGDRLQRVAQLIALESPQAIYQQLVSPGLSSSEIMPDVPEPYLANFHRSHPGHPIASFQLIDMLTYLPDDILTKVDRASMAVSLESRVPLLDHRVIEWAWALPMSMKIRRGSSKYILKQLLYHYVPASLVERPKMGFGVPMDAWLRGPLKEWAEDLLFDPTLAIYFDTRPIHTYWREHSQGDKNHQYLLWVILMFQNWQRRWIK